MKVPAGIGLRVDSVHHGSQSRYSTVPTVCTLPIILNHIDASKTTNSLYIRRHEMAIQRPDTQQVSGIASSASSISSSSQVTSIVREGCFQPSLKDPDLHGLAIEPRKDD